MSKYVHCSFSRILFKQRYQFRQMPSSLSYKSPHFQFLWGLLHQNHSQSPERARAARWQQQSALFLECANTSRATCGVYGRSRGLHGQLGLLGHEEGGTLLWSVHCMHNGPRSAAVSTEGLGAEKLFLAMMFNRLTSLRWVTYAKSETCYW